MKTETFYEIIGVDVEGNFFKTKIFFKDKEDAQNFLNSKKAMNNISSRTDGIAKPYIDEIHITSYWSFREYEKIELDPFMQEIYANLDDDLIEGLKERL